jgi:hypothetical protein
MNRAIRAGSCIPAPATLPNAGREGKLGEKGEERTGKEKNEREEKKEENKIGRK